MLLKQTYHRAHQSSTEGHGHQYHFSSISGPSHSCKTLAAVLSAEMLPLQGTPSVAVVLRTGQDSCSSPVHDQALGRRLVVHRLHQKR